MPTRTEKFQDLKKPCTGLQDPGQGTGPRIMTKSHNLKTLKLVIYVNLNVGSHVLAGLVLAQRSDAAHVEDILSDKWTGQLTDESFLIGDCQRRLDDGSGSRHGQPRPG